MEQLHGLEPIPDLSFSSVVTLAKILRITKPKVTFQELFLPRTFWSKIVSHFQSINHHILNVNELTMIRRENL